MGRRDDRPHRTGLGLALEARGDHHQFDGIAQLRLFARTPDDVGIVDHAVVVLHAGVGLDILQNPHHLLVHQSVGVRHRDVQQDILGPRNEVMIQQRRAQRRFGDRFGAVVALGRGHGHVGPAAVAHHLRHIGEIDVHQVAFDGDDLGDALGRRGQNVVGLSESLLEREAAVNLQNVLVVDDQQRIGVLTQLLDSPERLFVTDLSLDGQRRSDDGHRQQSHLAGQLGDDGRGARTGSAAHAGRDEDHLRAGLFERLPDFGQRLDSRTTPVLGIVAGSEPLGSEAYLQLDRALVERLLVGIADHERNPPDTEIPHVVHGIAPGAADAYDRNDRAVHARSLDFRHQFVCHIVNSPYYPSNINYPSSAGECPSFAAFARGVMYFLTAKSTRNSPTDVSACDGIGSGILIPLYLPLPGKPKITFQLP